MNTSTELRIPTQTFLLPGQEFCIGLPWERADLPKHGRAPAYPMAAAARLTLRGEGEKIDPFQGFEIGACTVLRRLSEGGAKTLLAVRRDAEIGSSLVVLRRLELPEVLSRDVRNHAEWAQHFSHPNLVPVFPCEVSEEGVFWVTELASGATLTELVGVMKKNGQSVPLGLALGATVDIARALGELHSRGAAHGLVSDQSVAVGFDGTARLHDTGLFRCMAQGASWLELRECMAAFFAPEQLLEGRLPDPKTDVYSLGAVLYECLTGEKVRRARNFDQHVKLAQESNFIPASKLNVTINPALDAVVTKALNPRRSERFANGREFALALAEAAAVFTWRKELRSQFVARHFEPRKLEEESLRRQLASMPSPKPTARTLTPRELFEDIKSQVLSEPEPAPSLALPVAAPPSPPTPVFSSFTRSKSASGSKKKKKGKAVASPVSFARLVAVFALGLFAGVTGAWVRSVVSPPPKPLPPLTWLEDVSSDAVAVELTVPVASVSEASFEPVLLEGTGLAEVRAAVKPVVAKKKRRSKDDDVPLPPWLAKKSRRR
ncbi:MAG: protein kinase [Myxococcaceae bacterium]